MDVECHIVSVTLDRSLGVDQRILRDFSAIFATYVEGEDEEVEIGYVSGWIGWNILDEDIFDEADAISADCAPLGWIAVSIRDAHRDRLVDSALLIDRMHLNVGFRGNRISGSMVDTLMGFLRLDPEATATVLQPEPQIPDGGPMPMGKARDRAMGRLCDAYRHSGFTEWDASGIWWRPF